MGKKAYFPALDPLRALAMLMVFSDHAERAKRVFGWDRYGIIWGMPLSRFGLTLFFVLSGFLITYLLLVEKQEAGTLSVPRFYLRRILRIWPLYYLIILIGFLIIPHSGLQNFVNQSQGSQGSSFTTFLLYLFFLPNVVFLSNLPNNFGLTHTWSIGTEEQFYILWPWIIKRFNRYLPIIMWSLVGLTILSGIVYDKLDEHMPKGNVWLLCSKINTVIYWSRIGYFSLGGILAWYKLKDPKLTALLCTPFAQVINFLLFCMLTFWVKNNISTEFVAAFFFALTVLHATQPGTLLSRWRSPLFVYLGKISYGMYIFHMIMILVTYRLIGMTGLDQLPKIVFCLLSYFLSLGLTIVAGALSYRYFESFFLRLKRKYQ